MGRTMNRNSLFSYDFIEIGTCDFDTELQRSDGTRRGISVEPVKGYLDALPNIQGVMKEWNKKNPEYVNKWRTENSDKVKQYREAHKPRARERVKEQYWKDPESARLKSRQYKEANKEFVKRRKKEWNADSKEHLRMYYNKKTEQLSDSYIRNKLAANHKRERTLCSEDIPQDLVELKRLQLLIQRELRK